MAQKNYYIKTDDIKKNWEDKAFKRKEKYGWDIDHIVKKFQRILHKIDEASDEKESLDNLFRSKGGEKKGDYIFFDTREILEYKEKLNNASLAEYCKMLEKAPPYFYDYDTDACDTMRYIFEKWDAIGKKGGFTRAEMEEFGKKLQNLIPWTDDREKIISIIIKGDLESEELMEAIRRENENFDRRKERIRKGMERLYKYNRISSFYTERIFNKDKYASNGQWELLIEWKKKWEFVIDEVDSLYSVEYVDKKQLGIQNIIKVLLIWYQYKKIKNIKTADEKPEDEKPDSSMLCLFRTGCQQVVDNIQDNAKLKKLTSEERDYILRECKEDLLNIKEAVERNIEIIKKSDTMEKAHYKEQKCNQKNMVLSMMECIKIINPQVDRINLLEMDE